MNEPRVILISDLKSEEVLEASWLLANSMSTNPNLVAIFKSTKVHIVKKQQKMFEMVLNDKNNISFKAEIHGQMVGTMTYASSEFCQMRTVEILKLLPKFAGIFGIHFIPVLKWRMNWAGHDYKACHIHFGPLAVDRNHQGMGVGKALLSHFCNYLDVSKQIGYLETDKAENVALYEKFGFQIQATDNLFGVKNWFMLRKAN